MRRFAVALVLLSLPTMTFAQGPSVPTQFKIVAEEPAAAPKLESLHCLMATAQDGLLTRSELWAEGNKSRSDLLQVLDKKLKPPVVSIQVADTIYTFERGAKKGTKLQLPGFAGKSLLAQFDIVRTKGEKTGTIDVEGVTYEILNYDAGGGEAIEAWINPATGLPLRWRSTVTHADTPDVMIIVYADATRNLDIADDLFQIPAKVKFNE